MIDNEIYDYYRQESSNQDVIETSVSYECKSEGFHPDRNDCRIFYRCVEWGNNSPLTPFKFECGIGTVFSPSKGNICVHPNDSNRPECCEPSNEIDSNESSSSHSWNYELEISSPFHNPSSTKYPSQTQQPYYPNYPSQTEKPQYQHYSVQAQKPQQSTSYLQTQKKEPNLQTQTTQQINYLSSTDSQHATYPSNLDLPEVIQCSGIKGVSCTSSSECAKEGFFANPKDCHKFYRCVNENSILKRYDFTCGVGTAWDQTIQTCNHEYNVANCSLDHVTQNQTQPSVIASQTAGSDTSFRPPSTQTSQFPWSNSNSSTLTSMGIPYPFPQSIQNSTNPTYLPPQLTQYPIQSTYSQHSTYSTYPISSLTQGPVNPMQFQSTNGPEYIPPQLTTINTSSSSNSNNGNEVLDTGIKPCFSTGSIKDCKEEGFFPNPEDCHKFFRCVNENGSFRQYSFECGTGTTWNQQLQTCNFVNSISGCGPSESGINLPDFGSVNQNPHTDIDSGSNKPSLTTLTLPSEITNHQQPQKPPSIEQQINSPSSGNKPQIFNKNNCQSEGFFANVNECQKFYRCVSHYSGYVKYDFDCAPGTAWDQSLLTCNYIALITTCNRLQNVVNSNQPESIGESSTLPFLQSSFVTQRPTEYKPGTMNSFQSTININLSSENFNSTQESFTTSMSTGISSSTISTSRTEDSSEQSTKLDCVTPKTNNTIVCNNAGFYPHPTHCNKFYRCVDNGKGFNVYYFDCPVGTIFDPSIEVCNYAESVYPVRDCRTGESESSTSSQSQSSTTQRITSIETTTKSQNGIFTTTITSEIPSEPSSVGLVTTEPSTIGIIEGSPTLMTMNSESTTLNTEITISNSETSSSDSEITNPSSTSTSLESQATISSSETTTISSEETTSSSESISNSESITLNSDGTTSEITSSDVTTSGFETTISNTKTTVLEETSTTTALPLTSIEMTTNAGTETTVSITDNSSVSEQSTTDIATQETISASSGTVGSQESTTIISNEKPTVSDNCPTPTNLTDEQIVLVCPTGFRRHPKLCNLFYQCTMSGNTEVKILILKCPEGTIFDEETNKCLPESESSKPCKGTITGKRIQRGVNKEFTSLIEVSKKPLCPEEGHFPYRDGCSNIFYKCGRNSRYDLEGYLFKCPKYFVYWSVSRRCERISRLPMCTKMSNEIENENENWKNRWEIPVEDRNLSARSLFHY
ncbi:PREDICTED: uncharacterized protein YMR317W-like [Ceratosolen solmsi marchali]|uniref:Uncharacterized protein YMR317W-like n=1 Tax=Ceratosolen solmsi marchali TaxID=326594 RepID=A0AAJ6YS94_9HYME|nr:PREDICTED: uncharacterized protein YMR317W-like [Ceratosolen solmsi marchali]